MSDYKYIELKNKILKKINSGEYPQSKPIASERVMAQQEKCSRMTVRQAITSLVQQGYLYRRQGQGTFVSTNKFTQNNIMSFTKSISSKGKIPNTKVIEFTNEVIDHIPSINYDFGSKRYFVAKRVRLADDIAVAIETVYIPYSNCPNLKEQMLTGSLHSLMEEKYNLLPENFEFSVSASNCIASDMDILSISKNSAVLNIVSKYYTETSKLVYVEKATYRGDMFEYQFHSNKRQATSTL